MGGDITFKLQLHEDSIKFIILGVQLSSVKYINIVMLPVFRIFTLKN